MHYFTVMIQITFINLYFLAKRLKIVTRNACLISLLLNNDMLSDILLHAKSSIRPGNTLERNIHIFRSCYYRLAAVVPYIYNL